jgi:adenosylcobinamide-GDP ribazoletransferase
MSNSDTWFPKWGDIPAAIGLLSRLPVRVDTQQAQVRGAHPSWAYGLAGALLGALAALAAWAGLSVGPAEPCHRPACGRHDSMGHRCHAL